MGLYTDIIGEKVRSLALRDAIAVPPEKTVGEVIQQMRKKKLGCAFVVDADRKPIGAFSERSITRSVRKGTLSLQDPVGDHLDDRWARVELDDPIRKVLDAMVQERVRFVCVLDGDGKVYALTGQKSLIESMAEFFPKHVQSVVHRVGADIIPQKREGA